ncbi:unnamed protein product [Diamesa tonsa]
MYKYFLNYCNDTTVHGFKYYGEKHRHKTEKFFWTAVIFASSLACIYMFNELVDKIQSNPIVDNLSDEANHISEIPFPAFSFCPEMRTIIGNFNYIEIIDKINNNEMEISDLSDEKLNLMHAIGLLLNDEFLLQFNLSLSTESIMSSFDIMEYLWNGQQSGSFIQKYSLEFAKTLTPYGFCYTYNSLDASDLFNINKVADIFNFERTYSMYEFNSVVKASPPNESYPLKTPTFRMGLHAQLKKKKFRQEDVYHYGRLFDGHIVFIHKNDEFPMKSLKPLYSQVNETTFFSIKPQDKVMDDDLYKMSFEERNCYLDGEKVLQFFKHYSKNNCEQECLSEETLKACGCVQFFMIRNNSTNICGLNDKSCYETVESKVISGSENICQCLQTCNTLNYDVVMKRLSFEGTSHPHKLVTDTQPVEIIIKFQKNEFFSVIRKKQFSKTDFISYCGGILGLFAGISVLSFIELIYYFTIRVVGDWKRSKVVPIANIESLQSFPKQAENKIMKTLKTYTLKYFKGTSIHGFNYSVDSTRSLFERFFWTAVIFVSSLACIYMFYELIDKIQSNPIVDNLSDEANHISEIPFPAVSFCPEMRTIIGDFNYIEIIDKINNNEMEISDLSDEKLNLMHAIGLLLNDEFLLQFNLSLSTESIMSSFDTMEYLWNDQQKGSFIQKYSLEFAKTLTPYGFCYTFNSLNASDLFNMNKVADILKFERTYSMFEFNSVVKASPPNESYPLKTPTFRMGLRLRLMKKQFKEEYINHYGTLFDGHVVFIHKNDEFPMKSSKPLYNKLNETTSFSIIPQGKVLDDNLYKMSFEEYV